MLSLRPKARQFLRASTALSHTQNLIAAAPKDTRAGTRIAFVLSILVAAIVALSNHAAAQGDAVAPVPLAEQVAEFLRREPMTLESWPAWRQRLIDWFSDHSDDTLPAYKAAYEFLKSQANAQLEFPPALANDSIAWYLLGAGIISGSRDKSDELAEQLRQAEIALRRCTDIDPTLGRAHARLASVLLMQHQMKIPSPNDLPGHDRLTEAKQQLGEARKLDSNLSWLPVVEGELALVENRFVDAEQSFRQALERDPKEVQSAQLIALAVVQNRNRNGGRAQIVQGLLDKFPGDGVLITYHAIALAQDGNIRAAARELQHARRTGTDPETVIGPDAVRGIEQAAKPTLVEWIVWGAVAFIVVYAVVMLLMTLTGLVLARRTRGSRALALLAEEPAELVPGGQIVRASGETGLAKLYAASLTIGLLLFYVAIPFIATGILAVTLLLLYLIFQLGRIPVKLVLIIVIAGLGSVWAVLKSIFAKPGSGSFGIPKIAADHPRLFAAIQEVARRVDTDPVDEIYVAPGSSIGVHQEGRGPFGMFGVARRVLTLGLSTMHFLSVSELKSILAHEYAHFSHRDTFFSRFIHQVTLSINEALQGMGAAGGKLNYVNPFFWFLVLYYKSYSILAAGFSRSREFLADRMACVLYGSDVFGGALAKVATDGVLFESTIYGNITQLLDQNQAFQNMYSAFREFRDAEDGVKARNELTDKVREERGSIFSTHPTFRDRIEAVARLPKSRERDDTPALQLFENPDKLEEELTEFLTGYIHQVRQSAALAAQE